jgi:hypothetical protein
MRSNLPEEDFRNPNSTTDVSPVVPRLGLLHSAAATRTKKTLGLFDAERARFALPVTVDGHDPVAGLVNPHATLGTRHELVLLLGFGLAAHITNGQSNVQVGRKRRQRLELGLHPPADGTMSCELQAFDHTLQLGFGQWRETQRFQFSEEQTSKKSIDLAREDNRSIKYARTFH